MSGYYDILNKTGLKFEASAYRFECTALLAIKLLNKPAQERHKLRMHAEKEV